MISKIMQVLSGAKRDGKNICLGSDEYKELVKLLNPIALQFVNMLFEIGCVKSDLVKIQGDNFYGLRANLTFDDNNIYAFTDALIELDIRPSLIVVNDSELDLFFKPNKKINLVSNEDYLQYINEYESMGLKFIGWNLDCEDMVECNPNKDRDVSFSKEIFNTSRPEWIELITR